MSPPGKAVIIVDDDAMVRQCVGAILASADYQVRTCASPVELLQELRHGLPDVFLLDAHMDRPNDGIELCRSLKSMPSCAHIPVIMLTGDGDRETVIHAAQAGAGGYVLKSTLSVAAILGRIEKVLAGAASGSPPTGVPAVGTGTGAAPARTTFAPTPTPRSAPASSTGGAPTGAPAAPSPEPKVRKKPSEYEIERRLTKALGGRALPFVAAELIELTATTGAPMNKLVETVECDPVIAAKVLKMANSSYYRSRERVSSLAKAVIALGQNAVRDLAVGLSVISEFYSNRAGGDVALGLWRHTLACAVLARALAAQSKKGMDLAEGGFTAGLLHDLGRNILLETFPEEYAAALEAVQNGASLVEAERTFLGTDHAEIGKQLMTAWKIPSSLYLPAVLHHETFTDLRVRAGESLPVAAAVNLAERILKAHALGIVDDDVLQEVSEDAAAYLDLTTDICHQQLMAVYDQLDEVSSILYLHADSGGDLPRMLERPPETRTRRAVVFRAVEPRVDVLGLLLRRCGFETRNVPVAAPWTDVAPDLLVGWANTAPELEARMSTYRAIVAKPGPAPTRMLLMVDAALIPGGTESRNDPFFLVARPGRAARIAEWLAS